MRVLDHQQNRGVTGKRMDPVDQACEQPHFLLLRWQSRYGHVRNRQELGEQARKGAIAPREQSLQFGESDSAVIVALEAGELIELPDSRMPLPTARPSTG